MCNISSYEVVSGSDINPGLQLRGPHWQNKKNIIRGMGILIKGWWAQNLRVVGYWDPVSLFPCIKINKTLEFNTFCNFRQ